jgi:hypothetical protein
MRPGQNKRMRGRPSNNRRGPNPLTRSYESNGPDVKIRGNAHHVAEKYLQLARDAHTGGDPVAAENYLQHAEHYFRLIAAAQAAQALAQSGQPRQSDAEAEDFDEDDDFGGMSDRFASPSERASYSQQQNLQPPAPVTPNAPQPYVDRQPFEQERQNQGERSGGFQPRHDRQGNRFQDRPPRSAQSGDRSENFRDRQNRDNRVREFRPYRDQAAPSGVSESPAPAALPSFITAAPRSNVPESEAAPQSADMPSTGVIESVDASGPLAEGASDPRFPGRGRRRRLRSPYGFNAPQREGDSDPAVPATDETPPGE